MASLRESCRALRQIPLSQAARFSRPAAKPLGFVRCASSQEAIADLENESSINTPAFPTETGGWRPQYRPRTGERSLPKSRYQYRPPRYYRGPLHPIQSPASSDPVARDFVPGPFYHPRLRQTYESTLAPDLMTLAYLHKPPGTEKRIYESGLRSWDGSSPYHKNRALRAPRGKGGLGLVEREITFNNIPEITEVTIAMHTPQAQKDTEYMIVARSVLQALTGKAPEITTHKHTVAKFQLIKGKKAGVKATIYGNEAWEFVDKCIHLVFPRIKEWKGIEGSTGDSSGNLAWGFTPEDIRLFPEIEANYPMYPAKKVPGCRVFVKTTATSDRQARLLLKSMGLPFYGKLVN